MRQLWEPLPEPLDQFPFFLAYCIRELGLADSPTKQQCAVADWMMNGPNRQLTVAFRGLGKSLIASLYALWRLRLDPSEKVLVVSATSVKATDFSTFALKCIGEIDILMCLLPGINSRYSATAFDVGPAVVEQSPSMRSMGVMGSTTGQRCSCAILDDIETLQSTITQLKQERVAHAVTEIEAIIKPDEGQLLPRKVLYLGTPHTETSIYLRLVRERGYSARYWPALYPDDLDPYDGNLCPRMLEELEQDPGLANEPTDPERFSHEDILQRQSSTTRASFLLQYQLNTRLATLDKYPIRLGDMLVMDIDGSALPETVVWSNAPDARLSELVCVGMGSDHHWYKPAFVNGWITRKETWRCVLAVDPAGRGSDEFAWSVVAELNGNLFLLESGGSTLGYSDEILAHVARVAKKWEVNYVIVESNFGDGMVCSLLKPHLLREYPVTIEEVRHNQRKEVRLCDTLGPIIQQLRLVVTSYVVKQDFRMTEEDPENGYSRSLFFQASRLTPERGCLSHDDRLDALAIAVAHFVEAAAQDQDRAKKARDEQLMAESYEAWLDETGAAVDALALGWRPKASARAHGGISRLQIGAS